MALSMYQKVDAEKPRIDTTVTDTAVRIKFRSLIIAFTSDAFVLITLKNTALSELGDSTGCPVNSLSSITFYW